MGAGGVAMRARIARGLLAVTLAMLAPQASGSMFSGDTLDKVADIMAIVVLIIVPVVAIVVFWLVHVLPERFAEKRHHPQAQAIQVLCLLSLAFGGLLWPLAWLWAFTRPVAFKAAYGTEKHETYHEEMGEQAEAGKLSAEQIHHLRAELDTMAAKGALPPSLQRLRERLARREAGDAAVPAAGGQA
jgi:CBS domain containing-hemolysin-like protein